jgi:hypothetical protein
MCLFVGTDSYTGTAYVYRVNTNSGNIDTTKSFATTGHFRGDVQAAWSSPGNGGKPAIFLGNTDGYVSGMNCFAYGTVANLQHLNPDVAVPWSPKADLPSEGIWGHIWADWSSPNIYYGDSNEGGTLGGRVHVLNQSTGNSIGGAFPVQPDGPNGIKTGLQAWRDKNGNGHVIYVGNTAGRYMALDERNNAGTPVGTVIDSCSCAFGSGIRITTVSSVYVGGLNPYKMMIGTSDGKVYFIDEAVDPTPSY